ncbi:hypothetical protein Ahia01_000992200, partial [Argonauta hians]
FFFFFLLSLSLPHKLTHSLSLSPSQTHSLTLSLSFPPPSLLRDESFLLDQAFHFCGSPLPSQATILTLLTLASSWMSRNSTSSRTNVHTLSQKRYVLRWPLKDTRLRTRLAKAALMARSNWSNTFRAS